MQCGHVTAAMRIAQSGEVLFYPYYAAGEGYETSISITNTTGMVKGIKVAIREGLRGSEVLTWNLYLAPYQQMGFAIAQDNEGGAVYTNSTACTVPALYQTFPNSFVNYAFNGDSVNSLDRTLSGYVEVVEMGQWDPAVGLGKAASSLDCGELVSAWSNDFGASGLWVEDPAAEAVAWQGGGLMGQAYIKEFDPMSYRSINVLEYSAVAVAEFARQQSPAEYHTNPGAANDLLRQGSLALDREIDGRSYTYTAGNGLEAVSALLSTTQLFAVPPPTSNASEPQKWLLSMPTKFHHESSGQLGPFSSAWDPSESKACEHIDVGGEVREAGYRDYLIDQQYETLCGTTNFLAVGASESDPIRSPHLLTTYVDTNGGVDITSVRVARSSQFNTTNDRRITLSGEAGSVSFIGLPVIAIPVYGNVMVGPISDKGVMSDALTRYVDGVSLQVDAISIADPSTAIIDFSVEASSAFTSAPFTVTCVGESGSTSLFATGSAAQSPVSVAGLQDSITYSCRLFAEAASGNSEPVVFSIGTAQPAQPVIEKIEPDDGEIYLTVASVAGGPPIEEYNGFCTDGSQTVSASSSSPLIVVSGLTNDVTYTCTVTVRSTSNLTSVASVSTVPIRPEAQQSGLPVWLLYEASQ